MLAAMDHDMPPATTDPDATVDLRPPAQSSSNDRTSGHNKTLPAVEPEASFCAVQQPADDTGDATMDIGNGEHRAVSILAL